MMSRFLQSAVVALTALSSLSQAAPTTRLYVETPAVAVSHRLFSPSMLTGKQPTRTPRPFL
jgi:hypothetical protein